MRSNPTSPRCRMALVLIISILAFSGCGGSHTATNVAAQPASASPVAATPEPGTASAPTPNPTPTSAPTPTATAVPAATPEPTPVPLQVISQECADIQVDAGVGLPKASDFCSYEQVIGSFPTQVSAAECDEFLARPDLPHRLMSAWPYPIDPTRVSFVPANCDPGFPMIRVQVLDRDHQLGLSSERLQPHVIASLEEGVIDDSPMDVFAEVDWTNPLYPNALSIKDVSAGDVGEYFCVVFINWRNQTEREVTVERYRLKTLAIGAASGISEQILLEWDIEYGAYANPLDPPSTYGLMPVSEIRPRARVLTHIHDGEDCPEQTTTIDATDSSLNVTAQPLVGATPTQEPSPELIEQLIHPDCVGIQTFDGGLPSESDFCSVNKILQDRPDDVLDCGRLDISDEMRSAWPDNDLINEVGHRLTFKHDCALSNSGAARPFRAFDADSEIDVPSTPGFELGLTIADRDGVGDLGLLDFLLDAEWCNPLFRDAACTADIGPDQIGQTWCGIQFLAKDSGEVGILMFDIVFESITTGNPPTLFGSAPAGDHYKVLYGFDVLELGVVQQGAPAGWGLFVHNPKNGEFFDRVYIDSRSGTCAGLS